MNERLNRALGLHQMSLDNVSELAPHIQKLSDQYVSQEGSLTPWSDLQLSLAYLTYFMPLNAARLTNVWREVERCHLLDKVAEVWDIGSGPGTLQWILEGLSGNPVPLYAVERSSEAMHWHRSLSLPSDRWKTSFHQRAEPRAGALGVFSYSLLEMPSALDLYKFEHLLIVEPSTQTRGRTLMTLRQQLIDKGYTILAPCIHQLGCPLLLNSARDWCHQRFNWQAPSWWQALEDVLPMKNHSLTYSYLLASRTAKPVAAVARVIGDTLYERGKVRQLICRNEQREFLSWLTRHGEPEQIPHGALLQSMPEHEVKASELRVKGPVSWEN